MSHCPSKAAGLQVDEQFAPALRALAHADLKADQFLAYRRHADDDQHAAIVLHARLEIDTVGPDVDVAAARQVAALPAIMVGLPLQVDRWIRHKTD